jgi:outer membrane receptor protein involved in Fe transport
MVAALILLARLTSAQTTQPDPATTQAPSPPSFAQQVDVVAVTPLHGVGVPRLHVPANVQVFTAEQIGALVPLHAAAVLDTRAASVTASDPQGGTFQPDLAFRGFTASPLLGASQGVAVYQDGARVNEAFGDTVNWDALPASAIASINLTPGSNPLFGLNALGGALSLRTKDGFSFPGARVSAAGGSFGRFQIDAESGGHGRSLAYYVAGSLIDEAGWRDFSPSTLRRGFAALTARGSAFSLNVAATAASNDMTGNGPAPPLLLEDSPDAVFTHPDRTDNDLLLLTTNFQRQVSATAHLDAVAYYRRGRIGTFNGDAADDDADESEDGGEESFDAVNNTSETRTQAAGLTVQFATTAPLLGRPNHAIAGGGVDTASTGFDSASEWAHLTPSRGTIGSGQFDDDAFVDLQSRTVTASAFAGTTWSLTEALAVTASARANWTAVTLRDQLGTALDGDHDFQRLNGAAGFTYRMQRWLNVYGSYSQSSRVPTPVELTCADPADPCRLPNAFVSDPPLDQVVAGTWEAGARGEGGPLGWSVSAFATAAHDDIIFVSSGTLRGEGHFENVDRTRRVGVEMSTEYRSGDRLGAFATYTWQRATFDTDLTIASRFHPDAIETVLPVPAGSRLPGVPEHSAKAGLEAAPIRGLNLLITLRAQSSQFLRGDEANLLHPLPGFAVLDAQARQRITRRLSIVARIQNLFAADYYTFGVLGDAELLGEEFEDDPRFYSPGTPRSAWIGVEARF